jgi:hypothetical protein
MKDMNESHELSPAAGLVDTRADPRFGETTFRAILVRALERGYRFARFDEPLGTAGGRVFYLRHDVDISTPMALRLGEIEHQHGVRGNFFFQLNAETYSFFVPETLDIIGRLRAMGHCVGLHIDELLIGADERAILDTFDWVDRRVVPIDRAVSFHRPSPEVLGRRYAGFMNAYDDRVFDAGCYLSDSRHSLAFHGPLMDWLAEGLPRVQLLLHPEWWCEVESIGEFWQRLSDRRTDELRRYMIRNFPKVFAALLGGEERRFRL